MADQTASSSRGWIVTIAGLCINLALGVLYTWSIVTQTVTQKLKLAADGSPIAADGGYIALVKKGAETVEKVVPVSAVIIKEQAYNWDSQGRPASRTRWLSCSSRSRWSSPAALQDRFGPRLIATVGGVFVGLGMIIASFTDFTAGNAHLPIVLGFGVMTGIGIGLAYACATPAAVKWFHPSRRGLISGIVVAGFGLASVYTAPVTKTLITSNGLTGAFRYLGIAFFIAIIALAQLLKNPPAGYTPAVPAGWKPPTGAAAVATRRVDYTWREMMSTPQYYLLWLMYAAAAFAGLMMVGIIAKVAPDQLGDPAFAATWGYTLIVALAIGNGLGRPLTGIVSDKVGRVPTMIGVFLSAGRARRPAPADGVTR